MRPRAAADLCGIFLAFAVAGCPAFLSDDWRIAASDASVSDEISANIADAAVMDASALADTRGPDDSFSLEATADRADFDAGADIVAADVLDASSTVDAAAAMDADGATCTPFPAGTMYAAPAGCAGGLNLLPAPTYLWAVAPWGCSYGLGTTQSNTPVECQCQETYNCACVMAHKSEINLCSCATCGPVAYSCAETAGVPRLICPQ